MKILFCLCQLRKLLKMLKEVQHITGSEGTIGLVFVSAFAVNSAGKEHRYGLIRRVLQGEMRSKNVP